MRSRRSTLAVLAVLTAALALNVAGLLRYPGGPLREPSADGPLWLDTRPADQGSIIVGNTLPSDWAVAGRSYNVGTLTIHNPSSLTATLEAVTPLDPTGLVLEAVYGRQSDAPSAEITGFGPSGEHPDLATLGRDFATLPLAIPPSGDSHDRDTQLLVVLRSTGPGAFGFSALAVDYRLGPFAFHVIEHLALAGCMGPLPSGSSC